MAGPCEYCGRPVWEGPKCCIKAMEQEQASMQYRIDMLQHQRGVAAGIIRDLLNKNDEETIEKAKILNLFASKLWPTSEFNREEFDVFGYNIDG